MPIRRPSVDDAGPGAPRSEPHPRKLEESDRSVVCTVFDRDRTVTEDEAVRAVAAAEWGDSSQVADPIAGSTAVPGAWVSVSGSQIWMLTD